MYYKPTIVLGRAFYNIYSDQYKINIQNINNFLFNYLFNILKNGNYFNRENVYKCIKN